MLRTKVEWKEWKKRAITPKVWSLRLWFLCTALLPNVIYIPMKFHVNALYSFKVILQIKFKKENEQMAITPKAWCLELWFLCSALLLHDIYLPMKFHADTLHRTSRFLYATYRGQNTYKWLIKHTKQLSQRTRKIKLQNDVEQLDYLKVRHKHKTPVVVIQSQR